MTEQTIAKIANELFTAWNGEKADTLRLFSKDGKYLDGWCKGAIIDVLKRHLENKPEAR